MANHVTKRERDALWQYAYSRVRINDKGEIISDKESLVSDIEANFNVSYSRAMGAVQTARMKQYARLIRDRDR